MTTLENNVEYYSKMFNNTSLNRCITKDLSLISYKIPPARKKEFFNIAEKCVTTEKQLIVQLVIN